jgi:argininosuccinate lyase
LYEQNQINLLYPFSNATELADYLVDKNVPFRTAHEIVGKIVFECIQQGIYLLDVPFERYQELNDKIEEDVYDYLNLLLF